MATSLFGGPSQSAQNRHLVEFKAGKMTMRENNWVHPDKRKGQVYIYQSEDEGLMHFCWKDRTTGVVEDDLTIFPEETKFKKVAQCKSGRVFLLSFKNAKKYFFWMQEPKEDKDDDYVRKVNESLNNPPSLSNRSRTTGGGVGGLAHSDVQELLGSLNMTQNELMTLLSMSVGNAGSGGRPGTDSESSTRIHSSAVEARSPVASSATTGTSLARPISSETPVSAAADAPKSGADKSAAGEGKIQLQDLHNILSSISGITEGGSGGRGGANVDLSELVNMETMKPFLESPEVQERLKPHLPADDDAGNSAAKSIETNIRSAQFRSAVKAFGAAIQTGEMAPVIAQFDLGLSVNEAVQKGDIVAFAKALEENAKKKQEQDKPDEPEKMDEN